MDIDKIRWLNARLLLTFSESSYVNVSIILERDKSLIGKWFNKHRFTKSIGSKIARHIEVCFRQTILMQAQGSSVEYWLDQPHYAMWRNILEENEGSSRDESANYVVHYPSQLMHKAIVVLTEYLVCNQLTIDKPEIFADLCVNLTAVYAGNNSEKDKLILVLKEKLGNNNNYNHIPTVSKKVSSLMPNN